MNSGLRKLKSCTNKLTISKRGEKMYVVLCADKKITYLKQNEKTLVRAMTTAVAAEKIVPKQAKIIVYDNNTSEVLFELANR